ncbi:DMT family transporter [Mariniluteicoccus flavus]
MAWIVLIISGLFEAVWATALDRSNGFTRFWPVVVFLIGSVISVGGLGWALKTLPVGTAYVVWVGIGGVTTVAYAMLTGSESVSVAKIVLILGILGCVAGLKALH